MINDYVGYWKLDELTNGNALDSSGNGNNGTSTGTTVVTGKISGKARHFVRANSDKIDLGTGSALNLTSAFSIAAWINPDSFSNYQNAICKVATNGLTVQYGMIVFADAHWEAQIGGNPSSSGGALTTGTWWHLCMTFDGTNARAYLNGLFTSATNTGATTGNANSTVIGADTVNIRYFDGTIDEVRIYNRVLSDIEVNQVFGFGNFHGLSSNATRPGRYKPGIAR